MNTVLMAIAAAGLAFTCFVMGAAVCAFLIWLFFVTTPRYD